MENFPAGYNPLSVLAIDMFTMTEEKLQDQLTKTMSVAFEGMVEMGGAALETRRLTVRTYVNILTPSSTQKI